MIEDTLSGEYLLEEPEEYQDEEELVLGQDNWYSRGGMLDLPDIDDDGYDSCY
jgi:hypothetical protein